MTKKLKNQLPFIMASIETKENFQFICGVNEN